ncbi:hypothetical protein [Secundilactobacillus silagei]|uniref:hypothetical protein n=1 Tax=Secundilactobacillus silagei TaxID=1293415 RepID=UPI0006D0158D|nr:hypothetical protein [Secundilactobacillus silagei]
MKNRILKGIASLSLGIGLFGAGSVVANNYVNASAKTSSVQNTGKKTSKYTVKTWKQLWSSKYKNKLDQYGIEKYSMLYKNTKLYKNREYAGSTPAYSHKGYIPKTDIELATGVWHINLHCDIFAYMTNGHQIYLGANPSKSVEVVPGWHNLNDHFTNNTKHWKLYFVHGNGRIPNENERCYAETDNGTPTRVADKKSRLP